MKKYFYYIKTILFATVAFLFLQCFFCVGTVNNTAFADAETVTSRTTATYFSGLNGKYLPQYTQSVDYFSDYFNNGNNYAKDIVIEFTVNDAAYYGIGYTLNGEIVTDGNERRLPVPGDGKVYFETEKSGVYVVTCTAYDESERMIASESVTVKSDTDKPSLPKTNAMDGWLADGTKFDIDIDWTDCKDVLSGLAHVLYTIDSDRGGEIKEVKDINNLSHSAIPIMHACSLGITLYDKAGNGIEIKNIPFTSFDATVPPKPTYSVSPQLGKDFFAKEYKIDVFYPDDPESGATKKHHYILNGITEEYGGTIILDEQKNYLLSFYNENNAGQKSEYVEINIAGSAFDITEPHVDRMQAKIDLTEKAGIVCVSFIANDYGESGLKGATVKGAGLPFSMQKEKLYDSFSLYNDWLQPSMTVLIEDQAGNVANWTVMIEYLDDKTVTEEIKTLIELYRNTDFSSFPQESKEKIDSLYMQMNHLLNTSNNELSAIYTLYEAICDRFKPVATCEYEIVSAPDCVSSVLHYEIEQEDFANGTFGNTVTLKMYRGTNAALDYLRLAGMESGFQDYFHLELYYNGAVVTEPLKKGISVYMNCPTGYPDRRFVLIDQKNGTVVPTQTVNNEICFEMKESMSLALVVSGSREMTEYVPVASGGEKITVFGREWPKSTFLWLVCGTAGGALLLILLLTILALVKK